MNDALVIVPTFNESESVIGVLDRLEASGADVDVLVVDDGSPDGTGELVEDYARTHPDVHVLHRPVKDGLGHAYIAGFTWAFERGYDWIVEMDADGSHDPAVVPTLLAIARGSSADLVIGSRWVPGGSVDGWSRVRRFLSRAGNAYARFALRSSIRDLTAGFRVLNRSTLESLTVESLTSSGYCFQIEVAHRIEQRGGTVIEHPIRFVERAHGQSKMHGRIVFEALLRITVWGFARPRSAD